MHQTDQSIPEIFKNAKDILWDFDGVIKDSVEVKSNAFANLFVGCPEPLISRVRNHHLKNGGKPRFEKIPIYAQWASEYGIEVDLNTLLERFSTSVVDQVIASDWVSGVEHILRNRSPSQRFFLVTATPQDEIRTILEALDLLRVFEDFRGAPRSKVENASDLMNDFEIDGAHCVVIGDSVSDYDVANFLGTEFILRKASYNRGLQRDFLGLQIGDFSNWTR
jgi:phosphoglycolate phosphatase-like HAD superfamily hydrolase